MEITLSIAQSHIYKFKQLTDKSFCLCIHLTMCNVYVYLLIYLSIQNAIKRMESTLNRAQSDIQKFKQLTDISFYLCIYLSLCMSLFLSLYLLMMKSREWIQH